METLNENIINYYNQKIKEHGFNANGMDWKNKETQCLRFKIINKHIDFSQNPSILDVGCGDAEFHNFCNKNKLDHTYSGVDINALMVKESNKKYGKDTSRLIKDLKELELEKLSFDYVICSGTFNAKLDSSHEEWKMLFYRNLKKMYSLSKKGFIFNCMTPVVDYKYERLFYPQMDDLSSFIGQNLNRNFIIDHSYDLYEMTITVNR